MLIPAILLPEKFQKERGLRIDYLHVTRFFLLLQYFCCACQYFCSSD